MTERAVLVLIHEVDEGVELFAVFNAWLSMADTVKEMPGVLSLSGWAGIKDRADAVIALTKEEPSEGRG